MGPKDKTDSFIFETTAQYIGLQCQSSKLIEKWAWQWANCKVFVGQLKYIYLWKNNSLWKSTMGQSVSLLVSVTVTFGF